jgi:hypothetical protein
VMKNAPHLFRFTELDGSFAGNVNEAERVSRSVDSRQ